MIAMTACVRPTARQAAPVIVALAARLREFEHVKAGGEIVVRMPELGSVLVTEHPGEIRLCVVARSPLTEATARALVTTAIRRAAGMKAASMLTITWSPEPMVPMPLR
jgi:hypothetical protein